EFLGVSAPRNVAFALLRNLLSLSDSGGAGRLACQFRGRKPTPNTADPGSAGRRKRLPHLAARAFIDFRGPATGPFLQATPLAPPFDRKFLGWVAGRGAAFALLTILAGVNLGLAAPLPLTLAEAHRIALDAHPQIASSRFTAAAAGQVVREVRSAELPTFFGSITGAGADSGS